MSYEKLGFTSGQKLKAEHLNHMEEGIANAGGVSSWNDLKDKPFGSEVIEGVITFDGYLEGHEYYGDEDSGLVKVSDKILNVQDLVGANWVAYSGGSGKINGIFSDADVHDAVKESMENGDPIPVENPVLIVADCYISGFLTLYVYVCQNVESVTGLPDGTYFGINNDLYTGFIHSISCLTDEVETIKTIDPKYLPKALQFGEEQAFEPIVWDGNTEGKESVNIGPLVGVELFPVYKIATQTLSASQYDGASICDLSHTPGPDIKPIQILELVNGSTDTAKLYTFTFGYLENSEQNEWSSYCDGAFVVVTGENPYGVPVGIYVNSMKRQNAYEEHLPVKIFKETIKPLDEKYLPDTAMRAGSINLYVAQYGDFLCSDAECDFNVTRTLLTSYINSGKQMYVRSVGYGMLDKICPVLYIDYTHAEVWYYAKDDHDNLQLYKSSVID